MRKLYSLLLLLHPPAFRRQFAGEMLCIFDESVPSASAVPLILDGLASLGRQWLLRGRFWRFALAIAGACLQVIVAGTMWLALAENGFVYILNSLAEPVTLHWLMRFIAVASVTIVVAVAVAASWTNKFLQARSRNLRAVR